MLLGHEVIRYKRVLVSYYIPNRPTYTIFVLSRPKSKELVFSESLGFRMKRWFGGTFNGRGLSRQPGYSPVTPQLCPYYCVFIFITTWRPKHDLLFADWLTGWVTAMTTEHRRSQHLAKNKNHRGLWVRDAWLKGHIPWATQATTLHRTDAGLMAGLVHHGLVPTSWSVVKSPQRPSPAIWGHYVSHLFRAQVVILAKVQCAEVGTGYPGL